MKMFKALGVMGALSLAALSSAASSNDYMHFTVPFSFVVSGHQFAPGEYTVRHTDTGVILVQGGGQGAMVISLPAGFNKLASGPALRFTDDAQRNLVAVDEEGGQSRTIPVHAVQQRTLAFTNH